ncbi:MAG: NAD-dependent epimerase/dehydratase family protein [Gammaproteobacteria bacterium]
MNQKIILPGGAGLVGQNLILYLKQAGYTNLVAIDKHPKNLSVLKKLHPDITIINADLAVPGVWEQHFANADIVIMLQAQIGGLNYNDFVRNNIDSTRLILDECKKYSVPYIIHISSSVVESTANDFYTKTKRIQEQLIIDSQIPNIMLRPTIMFGWFDRKHFGWLARFMQKIPIFPIPGDGKYIRQPLYVGDFCEIVLSCIKNHLTNQAYLISGQKHIYYINIIREIKSAINSKTVILTIPYWLFYSLIWTWSRFDRNPAFTVQQLQYLVGKHEFDLIDWPTIFGVNQTPFATAIKETFTHPVYSQIKLDF